MRSGFRIHTESIGNGTAIVGANGTPSRSAISIDKLFAIVDLGQHRRIQTAVVITGLQIDVPPAH